MRRPLAELVRPNVQKMHFYQSARGEFAGKAEVLLDANENPYDTGLNRYPDPLQSELRAAISEAYGIPAEQIFVGHGSSEALDLLMRLVGRPGIDRIVQLPPTFGMYRVQAELNDLEIVEIPLDETLQPDVGQVLAKADPERDKVLFVCTPNNPTGHDFDEQRVMRLVREFPGIVVIDQAYVEFSDARVYRDLVLQQDHVMVIETMSKAYGLAGARVGMAFGSRELIAYLQGIKPPYNVSAASLEAALAAVHQRGTRVRQDVTELLRERTRLLEAFAKTPGFERVYPTNSNFVLVACAQANELYAFLIERGIIIRNQTSKFGSGHVRINVGTPAENELLVAALKAWTDTQTSQLAH